MIKTKEQLKYYLLCDKVAMGIEKDKPSLLGDAMWKFQILYRKSEFHFNNKSNPLNMLGYVYYYSRYKRKCIKLCSEIPLNVIEEGLVIWHGQNIIISGHAKIGKNFSISSGCCVGQAHGEFPVVGNNVEMTIGSKILGGIIVTHDVTIGAGAVVVKDIDEPFTSWGGVPAKCISTKTNAYVAEKKKRLEDVLKK